VKILTGDNEVITRTICHQVGLPVGRVLLGSEIEVMSDETFGVAVQEASVFAKVSPTQKARVIDALHQRGHVVGFLGDGINDGPALKVADVGRYSDGYCQGVRRHHPAGEKPCRVR
jgi:Mg2+-importing ATPase